MRTDLIKSALDGWRVAGGMGIWGGGLGRPRKDGYSINLHFFPSWFCFFLSLPPATLKTPTCYCPNSPVAMPCLGRSTLESQGR